MPKCNKYYSSFCWVFLPLFISGLFFLAIVMAHSYSKFVTPTGPFCRSAEYAQKEARELNITVEELAKIKKEKNPDADLLADIELCNKHKEMTTFSNFIKTIFTNIF